MLSAHSHIAIPPETRFLMSVYYRRREWGELCHLDNRRAMASWIVHNPETKFKGLGLSREETVAQIVDGPPTVGSALGIVFRSYAQRFGKLRWGDKRPAYHQDVAALLRLFPDAQFVHVVRDGRDCVASLKRMPWFKGDSVAASHVWAYAIDAWHHWRRRLPADTWHEVIYERLVTDPRAELEPLCAYLGEQFEEAMLAPHLIVEKAAPFRAAYHAGLRNEVTGARVGAFSRSLDRRELGLIETVNGRRLRQRGYALTKEGQYPDPVSLARYALAATHQRAAIRRRHMADAVETRRRPRPVAARLTSRQLELDAHATSD